MSLTERKKVSSRPPRYPPPLRERPSSTQESMSPAQISRTRSQTEETYVFPGPLSPMSFQSTRPVSQSKDQGTVEAFKNIKKLIGSVHLNIVNGCYLNTILTDIEFKKPNSASNTVILVGKLKYPPYEQVIMKVSQAVDKDAIDNSLYVELEIYTQIINKLYFERITPHVTPYLGTFRCNDFLRSLDILPPTQIRQIKSQWNYITQGNAINYMEPNIFTANFVVLQMNKGTTLKEFIKTATQPELTSILFQVIYTLHCFAKVGLRHNDLHLGNILIETDYPVKTISYFLDPDTVYKVPTNGVFAKIYDFDRGYTSGSTTNFLLENDGFCQNYGTCNVENPFFDIFSLITNIYFNTLQLKQYGFAELKTSIHIMLNRNNDTKQLYYKDRPNFKLEHLMCKPALKGRCAGEYDWRGKDLPTPEIFLRNMEVFQQFKTVPWQVNTRLPSTFFANDAVRNHFKVRFSKAFVRPVINKEYIMKCIKCNNWPVTFKNNAINMQMIRIVIGWAAEVVLSFCKNLNLSYNRRFFQMIDEINEYPRHRDYITRANLQMFGCLFMHKYYGFPVEDLVTVSDNAFTESEFNRYLVDVLEFMPVCNSAIEYLYYCKHPDITTANRRALKKRYKQVLMLLAKTYSVAQKGKDLEEINVSPMDRAKWVSDNIVIGHSSDTKLNGLFDHRVQSDVLVELINKIDETVPKYSV